MNEVTLPEMLKEAGTNDVGLLSTGLHTATGRYRTKGYSREKWEKALPRVRKFLGEAAALAKKSRLAEERTAASEIARRPYVRKDYLGSFRALKLEVPEPAVIILPDEDPVEDGYRADITGVYWRGVRITSVGLTNHRNPSGSVSRYLVLYTNRELEKPWYVDAVVNGLPYVVPVARQPTGCQVGHRGHDRRRNGLAGVMEGWRSALPPR